MKRESYSGKNRSVARQSASTVAARSVTRCIIQSRAAFIGSCAAVIQSRDREGAVFAL
jgi:hypothetical protein